MRIIDHASQAREEWRPGVLTRMQVSAVTGSVQLCVFQQWCDPGKGAPTHLHAVEEILTVLDGEAQMWIEDEHTTLTTGQSVHVQATLAAPIFEASFDDQREVSRRWLPSRS